MLYFIVLPAVLILFVLLTVRAEKQPEKLKKYRLVNFILGASGILTLATVFMIGLVSIKNSDSTESWHSWAFDMFTIYFKISLPLLTLLLGTLLLTALISMFDKKTRGGYPEKIRLITSIAASSLLMLIAFFYSPVTENDGLPLDVMIVISGIAEAFAMRLTYALEYTVRLRKNDKPV